MIPRGTKGFAFANMSALLGGAVGLWQYNLFVESEDYAAEKVFPVKDSARRRRRCGKYTLFKQGHYSW